MRTFRIALGVAILGIIAAGVTRAHGPLAPPVRSGPSVVTIIGGPIGGPVPIPALGGPTGGGRPAFNPGGATGGGPAGGIGQPTPGGAGGAGQSGNPGGGGGGIGQTTPSAPGGVANPGASGAPGGVAGGTAGGDTNGGTTGGPGGAAHGNGGGGQRGPAAGPRPPMRPGPGPGVPGGGTTGGRTKKSSLTFAGATSWDSWWSYNRERFVTTRHDLAQGTTGNDGVDTRAAELRRQIVTMLRRSLVDGDYQVRAHGILSLAKVGAPATLHDFRRALRDVDWRVRESAIVATGVFGDPAAADTLVAILQDTRRGREAMGLGKRVRSSTRSFAAIALGLLGRRADLEEASASQALLASLRTHHATNEINIAAAIGLGLMESRSAIPALIERVESRRGDGLIRSACAEALGRIGDRAAIDCLVEAFRDRDAQVRRSAAVALGQLGTPGDAPVVAALCKAARTASDRAQRNFAIMSLGEIGGREARDLLAKLVRRGKSSDSAYAALALGVLCHEHGDPETDALAKLVMKRLALRSDVKVRGAYCIALGLMGHGEAADALRTIVQRRGREDLRAHACTGLGLLRARVAVPDLRMAASEISSARLRSAASIALGRIGDPEAVRILRDRVRKDCAVAIRGAAIHGLGRIGDSRAILGLGEILANRDGEHAENIRAVAASALGFLGDKDAIPALSEITSNANYLAARGDVARIFGKL